MDDAAFVGVIVGDAIIVVGDFLSCSIGCRRDSRVPFTPAYNLDAQMKDKDAISWQDAIFSAIEYQIEMIEQLSIPKEEFFSKYDLVITRVRSAWFDNWFNVLRPGYAISFDAFDKTTGEYVVSSYNESSERYEVYYEQMIGIEAIDGSAPQ